MKVVLDANVVIAAFATRGLCDSILEICLHSHDLLMSERLLSEIARNLRKKVKLPSETTADIIALLRENSSILPPQPLDANVCRDPEDVAVLGLAVRGNADCIVTGDQDLLVLKAFRTVRIVSPREFARLLQGTGKRQASGREPV
jgi:putative PIN family toxin of toxin-antitoxin system